MFSKNLERPAPPFTALFAVFIFSLQTATIFLSGTSAQAETRYVKPSAEVVVRRGQGNDYKVIAMVKDGTAVEFIEEGTDYTKVLLTNGKEGWILKRFLGVEPPLNELVDSLRAQKEDMLKQEAETKQKLDTLEADLARTEEERDTIKDGYSMLQASYDKLKQETADVVQINANMLKTSKKNTMITQQLALLEQSNKTLSNNYTLKWFLAGGGVLFFGMILGSIFRGGRRKKPSLL